MPKLPRRSGSIGLPGAKRKQHGVHRNRVLEPLPARVATIAEMILNLKLFLLLQRAQRIELEEFLPLHAGHAVAASRSSCRRVLSALRTQVLTVPSGCFMRSAISVCDKPS